jgi:glycosyltransferase involved in cell wall biosynthesis
VEKMKLAIVIPAYNEEGSIKKVLSEIPKKINGIKEIIPIVVDDGSTDDTCSLAKSKTKHVAHHVINLGVGAALTTGFEVAKKLKCDLAVTLDGDGQHNPNDIHRLIEPIISQKADVVIGTRMLNAKGMPFVKILGNWMMNIMTALIMHAWSTDTQSGMRALSRKALRKMRFDSLGYEISSEIIGETKRAKLKLVEVPIETIYTEYSKANGQSILNAVNIFTRLITIRLTGKK